MENFAHQEERKRNHQKSYQRNRYHSPPLQQPPHQLSRRPQHFGEREDDRYGTIGASRDKWDYGHSSSQKNQHNKRARVENDNNAVEKRCSNSQRHHRSQKQADEEEEYEKEEDEQKDRFSDRKESGDKHTETDNFQESHNQQTSQQRKIIVNGIHKQVFPGEGFLPMCTPLTVNKLFSYRITESQKVITEHHHQTNIEHEGGYARTENATEEKEKEGEEEEDTYRNSRTTTIYINKKEYQFEGFDIMSHTPLPLHNIPSLRSSFPSRVYEASLEEVPFPTLAPTEFTQPTMKTDRCFCCGGEEKGCECSVVYLPALEWLYHRIYGDMLGLGDWLECTSKERGSQSGCRQFHLYPRFVRRRQPTTDKTIQSQQPSRQLETLLFDRNMKGITELIVYQPDGSWHTSKPVMLSPKDIVEYLMDVSSSISLSKSSNVLSVLNTIEEFIKEESSLSHTDYQLQSKQVLIGHVVTTTRGPAYRVDDINFHVSPSTATLNHPTDNKRTTTFQNYYESLLNTKVVADQPLLFHKHRLFGKNNNHNNNSNNDTIMHQHATQQIIEDTSSQKKHPLEEYLERKAQTKEGVSSSSNTTRAGRWNRKYTVAVQLIPQFCYLTGIKTDLCQAALFLPAFIFHIRMFSSFSLLQSSIDVQFRDKELLKKAFTHPSYGDVYKHSAHQIRESHGRVGSSYKNSQIIMEREIRKRYKTPTALHNLMTKRSAIHGADPQDMLRRNNHNQRLEYLGDAVLEAIVSTNLFLTLPDHREGILTQYRSAVVNNDNLSHIATKLHLDRYLMFVPEPTKGKQHVFADVLEALVGSIYLDQGFEAAERFFVRSLFSDSGDDIYRRIWNSKELLSFVSPPPLQTFAAGTTNTNLHSSLSDPSSISYRLGSDRDEIARNPILQKYTKLEATLGIAFDHIGLLVQCFTHPSVSNGSTVSEVEAVGNNQRLEFLGDAIIELVISKYLYFNFPEHQEGQLTLLRNTLVNNVVLAEIALDIGFKEFVRYMPSDFDTSDRSISGMLADCFEAFVGALYLDKGMEVVEAFLSVVLFPRLEKAIHDKDWLDFKTRLQQTILYFTKKKSYAPTYKVHKESGPPHMKTYVVGVYSKGKFICEGTGSSRQIAEQNAAYEAVQTLL